jgi:phage-related protein (TIGR01555 family)
VFVPEEYVPTARGWKSDPYYTNTWPQISRLEMVEAALSFATQEYNLVIMSVQGLIQKLSSYEGTKQFTDRLTMVNLGKSMVNMLAIDSSTEEVSQITKPISGLAELHNHAVTALSAVCDIPQTRLVGQPPSGLTSDDKSGRTSWYDKVEGEREIDVAPNVQRAVSLATGITDFEIEFNPLYQPTDEEKAKTELLQAQADKIYFDMGANPKDLLARRGLSTISVDLQRVANSAKTPSEGV